ncbi:MAG: hypothetical protein AB8E15_06145 [Bdellovibrionales bacterium]
MQSKLKNWLVLAIAIIPEIFLGAPNKQVKINCGPGYSKHSIQTEMRNSNAIGWSNKLIIECLQALAKNPKIELRASKMNKNKNGAIAEQIISKIVGKPVRTSALYNAAKKQAHFGSWQRALEESGIAYNPAQVAWSRERILQGIEALDKAGIRLNSTNMQSPDNIQGHAILTKLFGQKLSTIALYHAAYEGRYFESWYGALKEYGINPIDVMLHIPRGLNLANERYYAEKSFESDGNRNDKLSITGKPKSPEEIVELQELSKKLYSASEHLPSIEKAIFYKLIEKLNESPDTPIDTVFLNLRKEGISSESLKLLISDLRDLIY